LSSSNTDAGFGPFTGVAQQVPHHLLEVLLLAQEFESGARADAELQRPIFIDAVERALQPLENTIAVGGVARALRALR
jgi:hypothetical protein